MFFVQQESKMGFGSKDEWCGSAVKYSMFLSNFIIFVSNPMFFEVFFSYFRDNTIYWFSICSFSFNIFNHTNRTELLADRGHCAGGHIGLYSVRQVVHQRNLGHQHVHRGRVRIDRHGHSAIIPVVFGMCRCRQGSQVHAANGKQNYLG